MKEAIIYVRRSTTKQEDSFALQRNALETFAEENGYSVVKEFKDTKSGRTNDRESFEACLEYLGKHPNATLLVYRLDRIGRNWKTLGMVEEFVGRIRALEHGDRPIDETLFAMLNIVAKAESKGIGARVKASYALRRAQNPDAKFGASNTQLESMRKEASRTITSKAVEFEQKLLFWLHSLDGLGYKTYKQKAKRLNELGLLSRTGCLWSSPTLSRIAKRARNRVPPITMVGERQASLFG